MLAVLAAVVALQSAPAVRQHHDLALAPRGDRIAAIETLETGEEPTTPHETVVVRSTRDGKISESFDPCPTCRYFQPAWSPDGRALAFVATNLAAHTATLMVAEGGKLRQAALINGIAGQPRWSPDGRTIALLATVGARKLTGATQAGVALTGEIGEATDEQRIATVAAAGGELTFASPADTFVYEYDWTPDGHGFVATATKGNGDNNWWVARLMAFELGASAQAGRVIAAPDFQMNYPRVSPDGKSVVVIGGLMSDFGPVGGDLFTAPISGGTLTNVTPGFKGTFTSLAWTRSGPLATALKGENATLFRLDPRTWTARAVWSAPVAIAATDFNGKVVFSSDGQLAATVTQDFEHAPAIAFGKLGQFRPVTHDNDMLQPQVSARSVSWTSDGMQVQGWLLAPRATAPGRSYPMVVRIHGGPSSATVPNFLSQGTIRDLVARGYYVFEPNPRGSYGQGEAFTRANVKDFGGGDLRDILAGIDAVEKIAPVDDGRLGVIGHSYGGYMTMWTVTHSNRFKAAVAGAGIANWMSYYGENGIDQWMVPFFGATAYEDPSVYERLSPIYSIRNARTPTFLYVGERDVECPPPQSQEFWHGLKAMGVPTSLVIYPGEGHGIREPEHVHDLAARELAWFDKYLGKQ